jgi:hypothetical protein
MAEEFENSFKDNAVEQVDEIDGQEWRDDDTSYDEADPASQRPDHHLP